MAVVNQKDNEDFEVNFEKENVKSVSDNTGCFQ